MIPALVGLWIATLIGGAVFIWWLGSAAFVHVFAGWCIPAVPLFALTYCKTHRVGFAVGAVLCSIVAVAWAAGGNATLEFLWKTVGLLAFALPPYATYGAVRALRARAPVAGPASWRTGAREFVIFVGLTALTYYLVFLFPGFTRADEAWNGAEDSTAVGVFAGCYELAIGRWIPRYALGHDDHVSLPPRIRLEPVRGVEDFERGRLLVRPESWIIRTVRRSSYWVPVDSTTVRLVWNTGFTSVGMRLRRSQGGLRGRAHASTDVGPAGRLPSAAVAAKPIDCARVEPIHRVYDGP